jgi:lysophospholipase L1-like esterase
MPSRRWGRLVFATVEGVVLLAGSMEVYARVVEGRSNTRLTWDPPELKYTLAPGRPANAFGYRERDIGPEKPADTVRIAAIGDSVTYGLLVRPDEAWPRGLELGLHDRGHPEAQVLDFGVPAYDSEQIAVMAERVIHDWAADVIVYGYYWNDPSPTVVTRMGSFPVWVGTGPRSFSIFGEAVDGWLRRRSAAFRWGEGHVAAERYPDKEEELDWGFFETWATRLVATCREAGVPLVVLTIPAHVTSLPDEECEARAGQWPGFCAQSVASVERASAWFEAHEVPVAEGLSAYRRAPAETFFANPLNPSHPSPAGQARLATEVLPVVLDEVFGASARVNGPAR